MKKINLTDEIKQNLQEILNGFDSYSEFTSNTISYDYAEILEQFTKYCPYCNINDIITIRREEGQRGQRMTFDHFICKSADNSRELDCENLIPSCHTCNSSYKSSKQDKPIINPFKEDFDSVTEFKLDVTPSSLEDYRNANILISTDTNSELSEEAENSIELFNLKRRYNDDLTKEELGDFYCKLVRYPKIRRDDINNLSNNECDDYVRNSILELKDKDINKTRYGKLKKDLINRYLFNENKFA